ncbi:WxL domain-containing protein [Levilactobacillus andaensis]|uniref:WxL domain-containing protein n=1 Tax=Levilactobacillus andaensis TaxID=2799570 RepID=UPI0019450B66|nr:WxL domain-containing protein [Levilactobacillus andaensis]
MTKKTLQLLATAALVAGFGFTTVTANAADTTETGSKTTTAKVNLTQKTVTPTDPDNPNTAGNIMLTQAPSFDFGKQELDGVTTSYTKSITNTAASDGGIMTSNLQVVNPGAPSGWNIQVKSTGLATTDGVSLKGSDIALTNGDITTTNKDAAGALDTSNAPTFSNTSIKIDLNSGAYVPVASAAASVGKTDTTAEVAAQGVGTWNMAFSKADLNIAGSNVAGEYTGNLVWALTNAPTGMATDPAPTK